MNDAVPWSPSSADLGARRWVDRALTFSLRRPRWTLALVAAVSCALGSAAPRLRKDVRIEKVFPEHSDRRADYADFTARFGRDDETALCLLELPGNVLEVSSLERIAELTAALKELPRVDGARLVSLTNAPFVRVRSADELEVGPFYQPSLRAGWDPDRYDRLLRNHPAYARRLISDDRHLAAFLVPLLSSAAASPSGEPSADGRSEAVRRAFARDLRAFFRTHLRAGERVHLDGFAITYDTVLGLLETDVATFFGLALGLLLLTLTAVFRRPLATALTVATLLLTVLWTLGTMALLGIPFNFISSCIPVLLLVACVGDAVHLISRTRQLWRTLPDSAGAAARRGAVAAAVRDVGRACFFTSATTAAGFASLLASDVEVVQELGAPVAAGVLYAYALTFALVPPALARFGPPRRLGAESRLGALMDGLSALVRHRPRRLVAACLLLVGASLPAIARVSTETRLLQDFDEDQPIMATRLFFERRMGGVAPLELLIDRGPGQGLEPELQQAVLDLAAALRSPAFRKRGVLFVLSAADFLSDAYHTWNQRSPETRGRLPTDPAQLAQLRLLYGLFADPDPLRDFLDDPDAPTVVRLQLRVRNLYSTEFFALVDAVEREARARLPAGTRVRTTGNTILSQSIHQTLVRDMLRSLGLAFVLVGGMVFFFFRSPKLALIALVPNVLPLLLVLASMGLFGVALTLSTSIVFTVVFGLSVDDTIHFVSAYARRRADPTCDDPVAATLQETGHSLVLSSLVLVLGFSVLLLSEFKVNRYFGLLVAETVVFALLGDLLLLPALLRLQGEAPSAHSPSPSKA